MSQKITVIIPILNESENLLKIYHYLQQNIFGFVEDIVFIDGGSTDGSIEILNANNIKFYTSEKGRAKQMNVGAKYATTNYLYFLHVDSFPPKYFDKKIINAIEEGYKAGCFRMKFDVDHWLLNFLGWLTQFNFKSCRGGDQSLFIAKKMFDNMKGYNEEKQIYEDNDLIFRIYKKEKFKVIPDKIITSSRRYLENGIYRLTFHFGMIHLMHFFRYKNIKIWSYYKKFIK